MGFEFQRSRMAIRHARKQRDGAQNARVGRLPAQISRSLIISGEGVGPCAVLQKASEEVAECLRRGADAEACAYDTNDPKGNAEYQRIAESWRTLARGYEFQGALGRFISFNESRKSVSFHSPSEPSNHFEAHIMASLGLRASYRIHRRSRICPLCGRPSGGRRW